MSNGGLSSPMPEHDEEDALETMVAGVVSTLVLLVAFGLLALGVPWFWIVFPVGFGGVLPAAIGLAKYYRKQDTRTADRVATRATDQSADSTTDDALEALRDRYARGEIDEAEFERRLDALLETESVEDAEHYAARDEIREQ